MSGRTVCLSCRRPLAGTSEDPLVAVCHARDPMPRVLCVRCARLSTVGRAVVSKGQRYLDFLDRILVRRVFA